MRYFIFVLFTCFQLSFLSAQGDTLWVNHDAEYGLICTYPMPKGQTLFSLSQKMGSDVSTAITLNPDVDLSAIAIGQPLTMQISPSTIQTSPNSNALKIYYRVGPKETMYTICRSYAGQDVKTIMELNQKDSYDLRLGEVLHLGYIELPALAPTPRPATDIEKIITEEPKEIVISINDTMQSIALMDSMGRMTVDTNQVDELVLDSVALETERGLAYTTGNGLGTDELLVLHANAKVNSKISIYNPMLKRSVDATVIAHLPENSYPENISVVISPAVAEALGALDKRFLVEMTYIK